MQLRKSNPNTMIVAGMLFLAAGSISLGYLAKRLHVASDLADGIAGLFYGLALGCLVLGLIGKRSRR